MHAPSPMAILLIAIVVLVLFGRGKVSSLMGEFGKGITAFKKGMSDSTSETHSDGGTAIERPDQPTAPVQPTVPVQPVPGTEARDVTPQNVSAQNDPRT